MSRAAYLTTLTLIALVAVAAAVFQPTAQIAPSVCRIDGAPVRLDGLNEASGLALGPRTQRLWTHNDSRGAVLIAIDARGAAVGRLELTGVQEEDWEAVAACGTGDCLYVGDIGDNNAKRRSVTVYRVTEPDNAGNTVASADAFHATYPDKAQDAETLLIAPDGTLFIVTKGDTGPIALYRFPQQLTPGASHRLTLVGVLADGPTRDDAQITDGTVSADGRWVVLRTNTTAVFYPASEFFRGEWQERYRVDVRPTGEPQGEGIALSADGSTLFLAGEGGGSTRSGTLARMTCTLPGESNQVHVVPQELPPVAAAQLVRNLEASSPHRSHTWRDTPPTNADDSVNAYIEIAKGNRDKWEFDMGRNRPSLDRVIPEEVGGYPVNYGFVPQTVSYDGDPFDALVLGPPLPEGKVVSGTIVGVMFMEDEKGWDAKVVLSPAGPDGRPRLTLTDDDRQTIGEFFRRYKQHESGKFSTVPGWGSIPDGRRYVTTTHAFFERCRQGPPGAPCRLEP